MESKPSMARSIHTTHRTVAELKKKKFADTEVKARVLEEARRQLRRKRLIKSQSLAERARPFPPLAGTAVETITIEATDESPTVHHAASPDDIRGVLSCLPADATEGIARVRLSLGKAFMDERREDRNLPRDPFTNRLSCEIFSGVYTGPVLGSFRPTTGLIAVYAYVYDSTQLPLPQSVCEIFLRLHALKTLIHEVAHHHDKIRRVARGRWLADRKANNERYAEKMEHQWTREVVLPYLQETYPKQIHALREWVAQQSGKLSDFFSYAERQDCSILWTQQ